MDREGVSSRFALFMPRERPGWGWGGVRLFLFCTVQVQNLFSRARDVEVAGSLRARRESLCDSLILVGGKWQAF